MRVIHLLAYLFGLGLQTTWAQVHVQLPYANPAGVTYSGAGYFTPYAVHSQPGAQPQPFLRQQPQPLQSQEQQQFEQAQAQEPQPQPQELPQGQGQEEFGPSQPNPEQGSVNYPVPPPQQFQYQTQAHPQPHHVQYHQAVLPAPQQQPIQYAAPAPVAIHQKLGFASTPVLTNVPGVADVPVTKYAFTQGFTQKEVDVASPAVTTKRVTVRRPALRKDFYDIEHRVVVRPAGSATLELSQPLSKEQRGPTVLTPTKFAHQAPVVRYGAGRRIVDGGNLVNARFQVGAPQEVPSSVGGPSVPSFRSTEGGQGQVPTFRSAEGGQSQAPAGPQFSPQQPQPFPQPRSSPFNQQQGPSPLLQQQQPQAQTRQTVDGDTEVIEEARDDLSQGRGPEPQQEQQQPQPQPPQGFPQGPGPQPFPQGPGGPGQQPFPQGPGGPGQQPFPQGPGGPGPQPFPQGPNGNGPSNQPPSPGQQPQSEVQGQYSQEGVAISPEMPAELQSRLLSLLTARGGTVTEVLNQDGQPADSASVLQVADALGDPSLQGGERITTRRIVVTRPIETVQEIEVQEPATKVHRVSVQSPALFKTHVPAVARVPVSIPAVKHLSTPVVKTVATPLAHAHYTTYSH